MVVAQADLEANQEHLLELVAIAVDAVCEAPPSELPDAIVAVIRHLGDCVPAKWPEASVATIQGGFLFLRLMVPCLVAPAAFGIDVSFSRAAQRSAMLAGKVVQNIANHCLFGVKGAPLLFRGLRFCGAAVLWGCGCGADYAGCFGTAAVAGLIVGPV